MTEAAVPRISIHALREEGDRWSADDLIKAAISIHALREEGDPAPHIPFSASHKFLSTPSARRATITTPLIFPLILVFLSTPSARRATSTAYSRRVNDLISIHALREEGDPRKSSCKP